MDRKVPTVLAQSFVLRGFDMEEILTRYNAGYYTNAPLPDTRIVRPDLRRDSVRQVQKKEYTDRSGTRVPIFLSQPAGDTCLWHRGKIADGAKALGLPIADTGTDGTPNLVTIGAYCSFECCLAEIIAETSKPVTMIPPHYYEAEKHLRLLFTKSYPGKKLYPAPPWRMHQINGGALDDEHFFRQRHRYIELPHVSVASQPAMYTPTGV